MEYLLRDQLNQFIGKEMRVLCVNEGILRTRECAYFIAEDDESAGKYFEEIKKDLPENSTYKTVGLDIEDISAFAALYDNDYRYFFIIGYGRVYNMELFVQDPKMSEKVRNVLLAEESLYVALDENDELITEEHGKLNIVQSFYSTEELAAKHGKPAPLMIRILINYIRSDVHCYTLDGEIVYGYNYNMGLISAWRHLHLSMETLEENLKGQKIAVLEVIDRPGVIGQYYGRDLYFINEEVAKKYYERNKDQYDLPARVYTLEDPLNYLMKVGYSHQDSYLMMTEDEDVDLIYSEDLISIAGNVFIPTKGYAIWALELANSFDDMYILTSAKPEREGLPFLVPRENGGVGILIFFAKEEADKYIRECNVEAHVGLIDNTRLGVDMKTLALIAFLQNINDIELCFHAPVDDEAAEDNISIPTYEVVEFMDIFDRRVSVLTKDPDLFKVEFNRFDVYED